MVGTLKLILQDSERDLEPAYAKSRKVMGIAP